MTTKRAIEWLRIIRIIVDGRCYAEIALEMAIKALENAPDINVGKWISVSERLPEDRKEKLVYLSSGRMTIAIYNEHRLPQSGYSIGWGYRVYDGYIDFEQETVIAWQPLPEPFCGAKMDGEEE